jgi:O-antigen ligase
VRIAAIGVIGLMLVIAFQLPGVSDLVSKRTATAVATGGAGRTDIWTVGLNIFESSPIIGVGYGNFPVAFTPEVIQESDVGTYLANDESARGPHSIIFGSLAELGIIGFIPLAMFILPLVLRRGWGPEGSVVQAALASLLVSSLFLDILNRKQLWLILGLAAGLAYVEAQRRARGRTPPPRPVPRRRKRRVTGATRLSPEPAMPSMARAHRP